MADLLILLPHLSPLGNKKNKTFVTNAILAFVLSKVGVFARDFLFFCLTQYKPYCAGPRNFKPSSGWAITVVRADLLGAGNYVACFLGTDKDGDSVGISEVDQRWVHPSLLE